MTSMLVEHLFGTVIIYLNDIEAIHDLLQWHYIWDVQLKKHKPWYESINEHLRN